MENKFQHYMNKICSLNTRYFNLMINIKKEDIEKSNSWPFIEAKKILKERKKYIEKKGKLYYKLDMALQDCLILGHLEKLLELAW